MGQTVYCDGSCRPAGYTNTIVRSDRLAGSTDRLQPGAPGEIRYAAADELRIDDTIRLIVLRAGGSTVECTRCKALKALPRGVDPDVNHRSFNAFVWVHRRCGSAVRGGPVQHLPAEGSP